MERIINFAKEVYSKIPLPVLNLAAPLFWKIPGSIRYGSTFIETWNMLEKEEFHTEEEFNSLINDRFIELIKYCYKNVPYYHDMMDTNRINPNEINGIEEIELFPFLDKIIIKEQGSKMLSTSVNLDSCTIKHTSGSTGTPLEIFFDKGTALREWANVMHLWKRIGYRWDSSRLVLRDVHFRALDKGVPYQWDAMRKELSIDIRDMSSHACSLYCKQIDKVKPEYVFGYPSAVVQLCEYIDSNPIRHHFSGVILISETVYDSVREYISRVLNTKVYSYYGQTERIVLAGECENYTHYHIEPTYGYAEIIDEMGQVIKDDRPGELVVTGFTNRVMPFVRYRTGDIAQWDVCSKCGCGRYHRVLKRVHGRTADYLYSKEGNKYNVSAIRTNSIGDFHIIGYQFIQEEMGVVEVRIIPDKSFSITDEESVLRMLREDTKGNIDFRIVVTDKLKQGKNGKVRQVVQNIIRG